MVRWAVKELHEGESAGLAVMLAVDKIILMTRNNAQHCYLSA